MMAKKSWRIVAWAAAAVLAMAGTITVAIGLATPVAFGWFAYQPLADATFIPPATGVFVSQSTIAGFVLVTIGLVGLAFLAGLSTRGRRE